MNDACSIQTAEEQKKSAIISAVKTDLFDKVLAALTEEEEQASVALQAVDADDVRSLHNYFTADIHQKLYCILTGANPNTFLGGNATKAIAIIRNSQQIAKHYWGAEIEPHPRP